MLYLLCYFSTVFFFLCSQYRLRASRITPYDTTAFQVVLARKAEVWKLGFWHPRIRLHNYFGTQGLGGLGFWSSAVAAWAAMHFHLFSPKAVNRCWASGLVFTPSWLPRGTEAAVLSRGCSPSASPAPENQKTATTVLILSSSYLPFHLTTSPAAYRSFTLLIKWCYLPGCFSGICCRNPQQSLGKVPWA